jgi:predicted nucleotidyltransferase
MDTKKKKKKAVKGGSIVWKNIFINWLHQGISYMDPGELSVRMIVEFIEFCALYFLIAKITPNFFWALALTFFSVHTFNWITNGNFWALLIFASPGLTNPGESSTRRYLQKMKNRLERHESISGILIFGSISRNVWHDRSDIDMRFLRKCGLKNLIFSSILTMRERFLAFVSGQPLDLFLRDTIGSLKNMRDDEKPVFLMKRDVRLDREYPDNHCRERIVFNAP